MNSKEPVTQVRIARDLGLSQTLVSKVLNRKQRSIPEETCRRIWDHALKIGYRPKGMQLSNGHASTTDVGFILRSGLQLHSQSQFWSQVQYGLHTELLARGYHPVFLGSEDELSAHAVQAKLRTQQFFGLVILGQVDEGFLRAVKEVQPNLATVLMSYPGLTHSVVPNEKQALELLVQHLTDLGHRQFAWVGGDKRLSSNVRRRDALAEALIGHGLKLADKYSVYARVGYWRGGWNACETLLGQISRGSFPTAWVCASGMMARGVISCLKRNGWRVPEEISVVAVDAARVCEEEPPRITGAHADPETVGQTAAELLLRNVDRDNESLMDVILSSHLTVRESTAKAAH